MSEQKKTRTELRQEEADNDLRRVMSTAEGRRFIWRQLSKAGIFTVSFVGGAADMTAFNEGGRGQGLALMADLLRVCPGSYLTMQQEAFDNERRERIEDDLDRKRSADHGAEWVADE